MGVCIVVLSITTCCSSINQTMREPQSAVKFTKDDFWLSEQVSAEARTVRVLRVDWVRLFSKKTGIVEDKSSSIDVADIPVIGSFTTDRTKSYALYNLMYQNGGYDVVFYPQYKTIVRKPVLGIGWILKITTVQATARLGRMKDDSGNIVQTQQQNRRVEQSQSTVVNQRSTNNSTTTTYDNNTTINYNPEVKSIEAERRIVEVADINQPSKPVVGEKAYSDYITKNRRPLSSYDNCGQSGKVILSFRVNNLGRPVDIYILRSFCPAADREAIKLLQSGPDWTVSDKVTRWEVDF